MARRRCTRSLRGASDRTPPRGFCETCTMTKTRCSAMSWRRRSITRGRGASGTDAPGVPADRREAPCELHPNRGEQVIHRPEPVEVRETLCGGGGGASLEGVAPPEGGEGCSDAPLAH